MPGINLFRRLAFLWFAVSFLLIAFYFRQIGMVIHLGLVEWMKGAHSLAAVARPAWQLLTGEAARIGFPAVSEAMHRSALAILGAGAVLLAAQPYGALVLRLLKARLDPAESLLYRTALGLGVLSYFSLSLAALGWYRRELLLGLLLVSVLIALMWLWRDELARQVRFHAIKGWDKVWAAITVIASAMALVGALAPEIEYDALWYHLWLPRLWLQNGAPVDVIAEYISLYPLTWELNYQGASVLGGPVAAKMLHWATLLLGALLSAQFIRRFFSHASPWLAAAIFVTIPTVFWEATTAYIDLALALYAGLAIYAAMTYLEAHRNSENYIPTATPWLSLTILSLGLALAIKHLAGLFWLLLGVALFLVLWRRTGRLSAGLIPAALVACLSLLLPLPWYLRAWLASGNPVFPDLYVVFGAFPAERWSLVTERGLAHFKGGFGFPRTPLNILLLPWNVTMHSASFGGSLGLAVFLLLSGAVFIPRKRACFWVFMAICGGYLLLWSLPISSFQLRFLVPLAPILAALASVAFHRVRAILRSGGLQQGLVQAALALLLVVHLPPFLSLHEGDRRLWDGWLSHVTYTLPSSVVFGMETGDAYLSRKVPSYQAWQYANRNLPDSAYVLTFVGGDHLYSQTGRISSEATLVHPAVWGSFPGKEAQAVEYLLELGVTHVLVDKRQASHLKESEVPILHESVRGQWLWLEYEDQRFALYSILPRSKIAIWQ